MVRGACMKLDQLVDSRGRTLPKDLQSDMSTAILRTITHPDSDIAAVVKRARTIAQRAIDGEILNVLHYATKALFATARKEQRTFRKESEYCREPRAMIDVAGEAVDGSPAAIEARVLVNELLSSLGDMERDVFVRYTMGWQHRNIGRELGISPAMSSYYLLRAKAHFERVLHEETRNKRKPGSGKRMA